jgi:hypothetical protein
MVGAHLIMLTALLALQAMAGLAVLRSKCTTAVHRGVMSAEPTGTMALLELIARAVVAGMTTAVDAANAPSLARMAKMEALGSLARPAALCIQLAAD